MSAASPTRLDARALAVRRYLLASVAVIGATLARFAVDPLLGDTAQFITFFVAIVLAGAYGGRGPAIVATALSVLAVDYFFVEPRGSLFIASHADTFAVTTFALAAGTIAWIAGRMHSARAALARAVVDTERNKAELKEAQRVAHLGNWAWDAATDVTTSSQELLRIFGLNPATQATLSFAEQRKLFPVEDWERLNAAVQSAMKSGAGYQLDLQALRNGHPIWVTTRSEVVRDAGGKIVGLRGTVQDISERKASEEALRGLNQELEQRVARRTAEVGLERRRLYDVLETLPVYVVLLTPDYHVPFANRFFRERFGDANGRRCYEYLFGLSQPCKACESRTVLKTNGRHHWNWIGPDGRDYDIHDFPFIDADGSTLILEMGIDVTERKRAEAALQEANATLEQRVAQRTEALRESEMFYRQTLESIPGMVFTTRPDGYCDYQSEQWVEFTGVPMSQHLGDGWNQLLHPDDRARAMAAWKAAVEGTASYDLEYRVRRHDGQYEWFMVRGRPIRNADGQIARWFGAAMNIEELKRAQAQAEAARISAEQAKAVAEEATRAKDHFMAVLSHELRTPLAAVVPALELLESKVGAEDRHLVELARRNVAMEALLIDDLLDVARIAASKLELQRKPVELASVIRHAAEVCAAEIEARQLRFGIEIADPGPLLVDGDAARLQQVFWNLLKNAIKFTPPQGSVGVKVRRDGGAVIAQVIDSGLGVDPKHLPILFGAFAQAERSITRQFGGLGLGLTICKALVEMHGGSIAAHSEGKGKGATFTVTLPVGDHWLHAENGGLAPARSASREGDRPLRILLVEDHGDTANVMRQLLGGVGYQVRHAGDVATALELAAATPAFDLLISDLGLPDDTGHSLMRQLRQRGSQIKGIALSGYGMVSDVVMSREAGFIEHVTKPVDVHKLLAVIDRTANGG